MRNIVLMEQVHGNRVITVDKKDIGKTIPKCDGLITSDDEVALCVRVADCLPISIVDKKGRAVGLIHAGWKGLNNEIISVAIDKMVGVFSINSSDLEINIGPHICQKHFEVRNDVLNKFKEFPEAILRVDEKTYLDLAKIATKQLVKKGVRKQNIQINKICTFENKTTPSYRRNKTIKRSRYYLDLVGI